MVLAVCDQYLPSQSQGGFFVIGDTRRLKVPEVTYSPCLISREKSCFASCFWSRNWVLLAHVQTQRMFSFVSHGDRSIESHKHSASIVIMSWRCDMFQAMVPNVTRVHPSLQILKIIDIVKQIVLEFTQPETEREVGDLPCRLGIIPFFFQAQNSGLVHCQTPSSTFFDVGPE
jgi:hypothetical protein